MKVNLAHTFAAMGHQPEFWLCRANGDLLSKDFPFEVIDLDCRRLRGLPLLLLRQLKQRKPDGILVGMWPLTVLAIAARQMSPSVRRRTRLLVSEHNTLSIKPETQGAIRSRILSNSVRHLFPLADKRIGVSQGVVDDLVEFSGLPSSLFNVVYNPAFIPNGNSDHSNPWQDPGPHLLTVGSLKPQKHQELAIETLKQPGLESAKLTILGEGPMRAYLVQKASDLGVSDRVRLQGLVADPTPWYQHADVFVLTSRWEGFGNVIVEAMQHGTQVVSTNCKSGPAEILENGKHGWLVPVDDTTQLSLAILDALHAPISPQQLHARASAFAVDVIAKQYLSLLFPNS